MRLGWAARAASVNTEFGGRSRRTRLVGLVIGSLLGFGLPLACGAEGAPGSGAADPGPSAATAAPLRVSAPPMMVAAADGELPSLAPILDRVRPGVVTVTVRGRAAQELPWPFNDPAWRDRFGVPEQGEREFGSGSGVIVDAESGIILTNHHVIERASGITVTLISGDEREAELVGSDPEADVAVLRVEPGGLVAVPTGDSAALRVGDFVLAIGNPFGLGQTVTSGIVSALGRSGLNIEAYEDFIQTDASINPGNSGGALVNLRGELVGINAAIFAGRTGGMPGNIGIGFAIPVNMARSLMAQILEYGKVRRGQLGVNIQTLTPDLAKAFELDIEGGALVAAVMGDSAAEEAGLKPGDVIVSMDGEPVKSAAELRNRVGLESAGTQIELEVLRDGKKREFKAKLGEREAPVVAAASEKRDESSSIHPRLEGVTLRKAASGQGVEVVAVEPGSPSELRPGDIIREVNRKPVGSVKELSEVAGGQKTLLLWIEREGNTFYLLLQ